MYRSTDGAVTFTNCSGEPTAPAGQPWKFNCTDECSSWSVVEVLASNGQGSSSALPAGAYFFTDRTMWQSTNDGQSWRPFSRATSASGHMPRDGQWGHDEFFSQSQVYQRRDGTFLHSARMNTEPCDSWAGEQLWKSNDTSAEHWGCLTQAAGGYCDAKKGHTPTGCYHQADIPIQCTGEHSPNWLKPGNHYSHWLRLHDDRLLLSEYTSIPPVLDSMNASNRLLVYAAWTHRSNVIDDDGYGTGSRGLISYGKHASTPFLPVVLDLFLTAHPASDDGSTFNFARDYLVIFSQSDDFCNTPVPWKGKEIELCCAPAKGGCACEVGYGNTIQLSGSGDLLTATSYYNASDPHPFSVDVTRWRLPEHRALKLDDDDDLKIEDVDHASSLRFSGCWGCDILHGSDAWTNLLFDNDNLTLIELSAAKAGDCYQTLYKWEAYAVPRPSVFDGVHCHSPIDRFGNSTGCVTLSPTYEQEWAALHTTLKPHIASGAITGIMLGDERMWVSTQAIPTTIDFKERL